MIEFITTYEKLIGAISQSLIPIIALVATIVIYRNQNKLEKRKRTLELHKIFQDQNFYFQVYAPVWEINLKWFYLPDEIKNKYRRVVALGWIGFDEDNENLLSDWIQDSSFNRDAKQVHYKNRIQYSSLTEHQALTIFLDYWSDLWVYIKSDLVDKSKCILFVDNYDYYKPFIQDLRHYIEELRDSEFRNEELPPWVQNTHNIEEFFDKIKKKASK